MVCSSSITASAIQMVIQELVLKKNCHCQQKQFCFLVCSKLLGLEKYLFCPSTKIALFEYQAIPGLAVNILNSL